MGTHLHEIYSALGVDSGSIWNMRDIMVRNQEVKAQIKKGTQLRNIATDLKLNISWHGLASHPMFTVLGQCYLICLLNIP